MPLCRNVTQILKLCKLVCSLSVQNIDFSKGQQCAQLLCKLIFILMVQGLTVNNALCSSSHCTRELLKRLDVHGGRVCNEAVLWMKLELCKDTYEHLSTRSFFNTSLSDIKRTDFPSAASRCIESSCCFWGETRA